MAGLRHISLLSFDGAPDDTVEAIAADLRALGLTLDGCGRYDVGRDLGLAEGNAGLAIVADFSSEAAYEAYRTHDEHVRIINELILPALTGRTAIQHAL